MPTPVRSPSSRRLRDAVRPLPGAADAPFERPKSRGTGLTVQQPSVKLWRITSPDDLEGGELLSANIGSATTRSPERSASPGPSSSRR
ncbi:hypothetical protein [Intrasporangium calvum]|uniref:hypothetical protein n=1 Tax=Intrasporangium calvum TaxID=53358 RepID=UPI001F2D2A47|nr:hypothetical protein [Intrasporangium calvum]